MKILIIRFSSLGDIAMATAIPRHLKKKFPHAQIDMAVREDYKELIEWNPYIEDKLYVSRHEGLAGLWRLTKKIRQSRYDIIIDSHRSLRSMFICALTPFVRKLYFNKRTFKRLALIFLKLNLFKKVDLQVVEYIKPLNVLGIEYDGLGTEIFIPDSIKIKVKDKIGAKISDVDKRLLIGFVPSAQWPGKRWPSVNFAGLAELITNSLNANIIVVGGRNDYFCSDIAAVNERVYSFSGDLGIIESAAALSLCDVVVANDTGMMHVAEAVGTDVIGIMGPTSYEFGCYPFRKSSKVVELDMWCRPCSKNGKGPCIILGKRPCLNKISPDMVLEEVIEYFKDLEK